MFNLQKLILVVPLILFSLSAHEFAHALIAYRLGDTTAKHSGRLSLNPLAHLDPFGTVMLLVSSMTGVGVGWARPVPINPRYFREPLKGMLYVALAGPTSNIILAVLFGLPLRFMDLSLFGQGNPLALFLFHGVLMNLGLAVFNLIPLPPLDGSRILLYFLRGRAFENWVRLEQYGFLLLFVFVLFFRDFFETVIGVPITILFKIITGYTF